MCDKMNPSSFNIHALERSLVKISSPSRGFICFVFMLIPILGFSFESFVFRFVSMSKTGACTVQNLKNMSNS